MGKIKKNHWKETVVPQGRRVLTHAHHLVSSLSKLLLFIWESLVDQSLKLIHRAQNKIYTFCRKWALKGHRIYISTKNSLVSTCQKVVDHFCLALRVTHDLIYVLSMSTHRKGYAFFVECHQVVLAFRSVIYTRCINFSAQCRHDQQWLLKHVANCIKRFRDHTVKVYRLYARTTLILSQPFVRGFKWTSLLCHNGIMACKNLVKWCCHHALLCIHQVVRGLGQVSQNCQDQISRFKNGYRSFRVATSQSIVLSQQLFYSSLHQFGEQCKQDYQTFSRFCLFGKKSLVEALHQFANWCDQKYQSSKTRCQDCVASAVFAGNQKVLTLLHRLKNQCQSGWVMSSRFILAKWHALNNLRSKMQFRAYAGIVKLYKKLYRYYRRTRATTRRLQKVVKRSTKEKRKIMELARAQLWMKAQQRYQRGIEFAKSKAYDSRTFIGQKIASLNAKKSEITPPPVQTPRWQFAMSSSLAVSLALGCYLYMNTLSTETLTLSPEGGLSTPPIATILPAEPPVLVAVAQPEIKTEPVFDQKKGGYSFWPKRVTLRHVEGWGEGVNFGTDYSTLAFLLTPDYRVGRVMPMLDLRGHRFDNNKYATNVGIAGRYIPKSNTFCQILGFNLFWDWRQGHKGNYNQLGAGLEVLGKRWDFRANGYAPIGVKRRKTKCVFDQYEGGYFAIHKECEFTSYGFNAEIGYYAVRSNNFFLYTAIGPYYLVRKCHDRTRGGMFRIRPQYKDYLAFEGSVSYDSVFKTVYQAQIILYLPLYQLSKKGNQCPCNLTDYQIYQPIERYEVMPLGKRSCWRRNF